MTTVKKSAPKPVLQQLLTWSANRPAWQRDALRRIVSAGTLTPTDLKELTEICRAAHEAKKADGTPAKPVPLTASHLPTSATSEEVTTLVSIGALKSVNRLPSSQVVPLGLSPGLTVIYGDNGTGKSGYARVLKKACRTRGGAQAIRPNAFEKSPTGPATATIVFKTGSKEETFVWKDGVTPDPHLTNVFIFDVATADNYLEQDGPATFTPYGLDVLPKLSKACDAIRDVLRQENNHIISDVSSIARNWKYEATTAVGKVVSTLGAATKEETVTALAGLDKKQEKRLKELADLLRTNPKQKAKETRAAAGRISAFALLVKAAAKDFSDVELVNLKKCLEEAKATAEAAKAFASGKFDSSYLTGTGESFWRKLWDAAREFSEAAAYEGKTFPMTEDAAKCMLCQQPVSEEASERLKKFQSFYTDKSQELAKQAAKKLKEAKEKIDRLSALDGELKKIETDLAGAIPEQVSKINDFVSKCDDALKAVKENFSKETWGVVSSIPITAETTLTEIATNLQARAKEEESADDPAARKLLENERNELVDREWLGKACGDVIAQIERYKTIATLEACSKETATAGITTKNSELTKQFVTDAFCESFATELNTLGLRTLTVKLHEIKGAKGETKFGLKLDPPSTLTVRQVASEGEQRCIALAAFLAELSQASHLSTLVFDDPVSSLDHFHREKIADRLVKESKVRQVAVFTHDTVFLNDLNAKTEEASLSGRYYHLEWNGDEPGHCHEGLPWDCKSPEDRLDKLAKMLGEIKKSWSAIPSEKNATDIRHAYSWLRQTLEGIVEKVVFADVVYRYRSYVKMNQLKRVVGFAKTESEEFDRLFKRCSDVTEAHVSAAGKHAAIPEPADLKTDIDATKTLLAGIRARQKLAI